MKRKYTLSTAFKELGEIDKKHEKGTYTKRQHDLKSKAVLRKLTKR